MAVSVRFLRLSLLPLSSIGFRWPVISASKASCLSEIFSSVSQCLGSDCHRSFIYASSRLLFFGSRRQRMARVLGGSRWSTASRCLSVTPFVGCGISQYQLWSLELVGSVPLCPCSGIELIWSSGWLFSRTRIFARRLWLLNGSQSSCSFQINLGLSVWEYLITGAAVCP